MIYIYITSKIISKFKHEKNISYQYKYLDEKNKLIITAKKINIDIV